MFYFLCINYLYFSLKILKIPCRSYFQPNNQKFNSHGNRLSKYNGKRIFSPMYESVLDAATKNWGSYLEKIILVLRWTTLPFFSLNDHDFMFLWLFFAIQKWIYVYWCCNVFLFAIIQNVLPQLASIPPWISNELTVM